MTFRVFSRFYRNTLTYFPYFIAKNAIISLFFRFFSLKLHAFWLKFRVFCSFFAHFFALFVRKY